MAPGVRVRTVDHGYNALMKRLYALKKPPALAVGILERDAGKDDGEATLLDVGTWNEFGTKNPDGSVRVPARPFIRSWFDENRAECQKRLASLMKLVIAGKLTEDAALDQFGLWAQGQIQARIAQGIPPANADSTIARKGSSTPLIDTGTLRSAVSFEVRKP